MTWIDNNGDVRPQSWEEYCEMSNPLPWWMREPQANPPPLHRQESNRNRGLGIRARLFRADPRCFWCGRKTELNAAHASPAQATVDHLYSRLHPQRLMRHNQAGGVLHVLACYQCNHERGTCENQRRPFIPKLPERLEFAQRADATLANHAPKGTYGAEKPVRPMRTICTLKEAIEFAKEHPSR